MFHRPLAAPVIEDYGRNQALLSPALELLLQLIRVGPILPAEPSTESHGRESHLFEQLWRRTQKAWTARLSLDGALGAAAKIRAVQAAYRKAND